MSAPQVYSFVKDSAGVYRPLFPLIITNPTNNLSITVRALLDTGADDCVFPKIIAELLKYDLKTGIFSSNQGIGQTKVDIWKHPFKMQLLGSDNRTIVWKSKECLIGCVEHDSVPPLLGFANFLCHFRITFNYPTKKIILELP